jgi:phospholipase D1/2
MNATVLPRRDSTAHQIVDKCGAPYKASITTNWWVSDPTRFADKTEGNAIKAFTTGKAYFADLLAEIKAAKTQILIAGWQVNWDALMAPGVRLYDALFQAAQVNPVLKIYIMPWDDHEPVQTYDDQTMIVFNKVLNQQLGRTQVFTRLSPTYAKTDASYFSHHQKQVVIDGCIAYIGGIDLAYGRYCDEHYTLQANAHGREGLNRYNNCVEQIANMPTDKLADPDLLTGAGDTFKVLSNSQSTADQIAARIHQGGWQPKYAEAKYNVAIDAASTATNEVVATTLDPACQPRMPWQDVHCRIEGPAASDLMRNFVNRWNIKATGKERLEPAPALATQPKKGQAHIQVLRSAPHGHCLAEYKALNSKQGITAPQGTQRDILTAMQQLIQNSRRFIYIENQFFVSGFGQESEQADSAMSPAARFINQYNAAGKNDTDQNSGAIWAGRINSKSHIKPLSRSIDRSETLSPPTNPIVKQLLQRIQDSALSRSPFHVYITVPVHPEGPLSNATIVTQVYWTMQTLVFGSNSLLNGIRRIIKARDLLKANDCNFMDAISNETNLAYQDIDLEQCEEFVTLLNLRNWAKIGDSYVTEQIYVHTKVMIVDDLFALMGSANINDRSLLGERDSELAVLVMDGDTQRADINGAGSNKVVRNFAHNLRKDLWKKIFGFTDGKSPASELAQAIEQPGIPDSWKLIQRRAKRNAELYEQAFDWVPRNLDGKDPLDDEGNPRRASILPTWDSTKDAPTGSTWGKKGMLISPMPFQPEFWDKPRHSKEAVTVLSKIKGFITSLPIEWTKGEYNRFAYPTALVADNNVPTGTGTEADTQTEVAAAAPASTQRITG